MIPYLLNLATLVGIFGILAASLNIMVGYAGIFSVAQAVFFGLGAYAGAQIALLLTTDLFAAILVAMVISAALSLFIALPALRVRDEYFVIASLGLQMFATTLFAEARTLTGGVGGLVGIPQPSLLGLTISAPWSMLVVVLGALGLVLFTTWMLMRGSFGRSLMAIRDSETAAQALGKNVPLLKLLAVCLSCAFAGVAGALFAFHLAFVNVESFTLEQSMLVMAMVIIGGVGTLAGPIVGVLILMLLPAGLSFLPFIPPNQIGVVQQMIYGFAMTLLMIYRPAGIVGRAR
jgi:branched-chain amino acid transport system permease protein